MRQSSPSEALRLRSVVGRALGLERPPAAALAVPVAAGSELLGALVVGAEQPWHDHGDELLRAIAHQVAVALKKAELIESLSEESIARELFGALEEERWEVAHARARRLGADLERPHVVLEARALGAPAFADGADARLERALRQAKPGTICDADGRRVRALVPASGAGADPARSLAELLAPLAREFRVALGGSTVRRGAAEARVALAEAADAAFVALRLLEEGGVLLYGDMGAYRYLVGRLRDGGPQDDLRTAVDRLVAYDDERGTQLLATLERYLENGRSLTTSARELSVHVNTLRQRLDRIEALTGMALADEDLLALQLAIKLARLR
jgi:sugar diacid utilization regulator